MKRIAIVTSLVISIFPALLQAQYSYYGKDPLNSPNNSAPTWFLNGADSSLSTGLNITSNAGGSYISRGPAPDGTDKYEVAATLNLPASGGNYVLYLDADHSQSLRRQSNHLPRRIYGLWTSAGYVLAFGLLAVAWQAFPSTEEPAGETRPSG